MPLDGGSLALRVVAGLNRCSIWSWRIGTVLFMRTDYVWNGKVGVWCIDNAVLLIFSKIVSMVSEIISTKKVTLFMSETRKEFKSLVFTHHYFIGHVFSKHCANFYFSAAAGHWRSYSYDEELGRILPAFINGVIIMLWLSIPNADWNFCCSRCVVTSQNAICLWIRLQY